MDGSRFDTLARQLASSRSRRTLLRGLAGGVLAAAGVGRLAQASCPREQPIRCGDTCVDLRTDPEHCGRCGRVCASGLCYAGRCLDACPSGFVPHQGSCVRSCPAGLAACGGACVAACPESFVFDETCACVCPAGTLDCGGACHECCTDADCPHGFACDPTTQTCPTGCAADAACADGWGCVNGACARLCGDDSPCPDHCEFCGTVAGVVGGADHLVCVGALTQTSCEPVSHVPCPTGQVCALAGRCHELCL